MNQRMNERMALAWYRAVRHVPVECGCESPSYGPNGEQEYGGYNCGCGPERIERSARIKRNRAQFRRYVDRLLAEPVASQWA